MKYSLKALTGILALSLLAACGGGGGDDGSDSSNDEDSGAGPVELQTLTAEQAKWLSHESTFTGYAISNLSSGLGTVALAFIANGSPSVSQPCTPEGGSTGTFTATSNDSNGTVDNGDTVTFDFDTCYLEQGDAVVNGTMKVTFGNVVGNPLDDSTNSSGTATVEFTDLTLDEETKIAGTLKLDVNHDSATADASDDIDTVKVTSSSLTLETDAGDKFYSAVITDYSSEYTSVYSANRDTFSKINYSSKGSDPILGDFDYASSLTAPLVVDYDAGAITSGTVKTVTAAETVTTVFAASGGSTSVKIDSTSGTSSSLTFGAFDDL